MSAPRDIMSTPRDVQYIGGNFMSTLEDVQYIGIFDRN